MKRSLGSLLVAALTVLALHLVQGCGNQPDQQADTGEGLVPSGQFHDDSLGVILFQIPPDRGWTLHQEPPVPGGPLLSAEHSGGMASLKLFVTPNDRVRDLNELVRRRRDQLASLFSVSDLDQVVSRILGEDTKDRDGYPAMQWQAMTAPVDVAGADPVYVMFLWLATRRQQFSYEGVGLLRIPVDRAQQSATTDSLLGDMAFMLETMKFQ